MKQQSPAPIPFKRWKYTVKITQPGLNFALYQCYERQFWWVLLCLDEYMSGYDVHPHTAYEAVLLFSLSSLDAVNLPPK